MSAIKVIPMPGRRRALAFALTLAATAATAELIKPKRRDGDRVRTPLATMFPTQFGDWRLDPSGQAFVQPLDEQGKYYGLYDQVLERTYLDTEGAGVMLCVAYGGEQSPALQVHRPEICYGAAGFDISPLQRIQVDVGGRQLPIVRLLAAKPGRSEPVTYWLVLGDEAVNSAGDFRWQQVLSGLRGEVRDGMLVRVSSISRDSEAAYALHMRFMQAMAQGMRPEFQARILGAMGRNTSAS